MKIILIGMKGCGKTTIGKLLAERLKIPFVDCDDVVEKTYKDTMGEALSCREILKKHGAIYFYNLEADSLRKIVQTFDKDDLVLSCGGGTPLQIGNHEVLTKLGTVVFLNVDDNLLLERITRQGIPAYFPYPDNPQKSLYELLQKRLPIYRKLADLTIDIHQELPREIAEVILDSLNLYAN